MKDNNILISVCMITYNQESYLAEAIYGVLNQTCSYPIELLIADDCSTDNTPNLVQNIIKNHPNGSWIKYFRQDNNLGLMANLISILKISKGKYIAICEGDDYWINPNKLQFQVDFLENNQDYVLCGHNVRVYSQNKTKFINDGLRSNKDKTVDINKLAFGNIIHSPSVVFRKINFEDYYRYFNNSPTWDYPMYMLLAQFGKLKKFKTEMAVYRVHDKSVWSSMNNIEGFTKWLFVLHLIINYFNEKGKIELIKILENQQINVIRVIYNSRNSVNLSDEEFNNAFKKLSIEYPNIFLKYFEFIEGKVFPQNKYSRTLLNSVLVRKLQN